jgi:tRNA pseudouridine38-40 synthase
MYNYKMVIEYDGVGFNGWQRQKNTNNTVQQHIESSLKSLLKRNIGIIGAGRTDAEVSAFNQVANFKTEVEFDFKRTLYSLNSILPDEITIKSIKKVPLNFHSRYSAKRREYEYKISFRKRSIENRYFYKLVYYIDFDLVDKFIDVLKGYKSFKSLCKNSSDKHNFCCNVSEISYVYSKRKDELIFKIVSDRFLHSMVRGVIGCLIDIGRGKLNFEETKKDFQKGEKIKATYLPGNALFLKKIYY